MTGSVGVIVPAVQMYAFPRRAWERGGLRCFLSYYRDSIYSAPPNSVRLWGVLLSILKGIQKHHV